LEIIIKLGEKTQFCIINGKILLQIRDDEAPSPLLARKGRENAN